jgi:cell division protein FtsB
MLEKLIPPVLFLLLVALKVRLCPGDGGLMTIHHYKQEQQQLRARLQVMEDNNQQQIKRIKHLRRSNDAVEAIARQDLGMIKQGELFFMYGKQ